MSRKAEPRQQYGAVPYRRRPDGGIEVLLITSRNTQRWIIPKGWPEPGLAPHNSAKKEAMEESGAIGRIGERPIGFYHYTKQMAREAVLCRVEVFPLVVEKELPTFLEKGQRSVRWFQLRAGGEAVKETELRTLIRDLARLLG